MNPTSDLKFRRSFFQEPDLRSDSVVAIRPSHPELPSTEGRLYQRFAPPSDQRSASNLEEGPFKVSRFTEHGSPGQEFRSSVSSKEFEHRSDTAAAIRPSCPELPGTESRLYHRFAPPSQVAEGPVESSCLRHGSPSQIQRSEIIKAIVHPLEDGHALQVASERLYRRFAPLPGASQTVQQETLASQSSQLLRDEASQRLYRRFAPLQVASQSVQREASQSTHYFATRSRLSQHFPGKYWIS